MNSYSLTDGTVIKAAADSIFPASGHV